MTLVHAPVSTDRANGPVALPLSPAHLAMMVSGGRWVPAPHLRKLNRLITDVARSPVSRKVVVSIGPRHGKSELISRYAPAWYVGSYPDKNVMLLSYGAEQAAKYGRAARDILTEHGQEVFDIQVRQDSHAANRWQVVGHDGGMVTAGMDGGITGKGADLLIIDDPVKSWKDAQSAHYREDQWETYTGTVRHRLEPGGSIICVQTRWHEEDLAGMLLKTSGENEFSDNWETYIFPAIAEGPDDADEGWTDELGRHVGEALWPERYPIGELLGLRETLGVSVFDALFQGRPSSPKGDVFSVGDWQYADTPPAGLEWFRFWDLAASTRDQKNADPDYTAGVLMARDKSGRTWIADVRRVQAEADKVEQLLVSTAHEDLAAYGTRRVRLAQDPGQAGKALVAHYKRNVLHQFELKEISESGDKAVRAQPYAAQQQAGNVTLISGPWCKDFVDEHRLFPFQGKHDDQVDAAANCYQIVAGLLRKRASLLDI